MSWWRAAKRLRIGEPGQPRTSKPVSVHGVREANHGAVKQNEKQGVEERRQMFDGKSEGGGAPQR